MENMTMPAEYALSAPQTTLANPSVLLLNLPHHAQVMRRYMCSSLAPNYLFPPQELLSLGGIVREWKQAPVYLLDAIAEKMDTDAVIETIRSQSPGIIVTIAGFEMIETDLQQVAQIKAVFPDTPVVLFGHYPTQFPQEILQRFPVDYIILGEPDLIFSELYDALAGQRPPEEVAGIAYRNAYGEVTVMKDYRRVPDPNRLPSPTYDLLKIEHYHEPFMPKPFGMVQSARGCPYQCNYCVKSFGTKLTLLTPERMMEEVRSLHERFGIRSLRFIDDTFTAVPKRVVEFCRLMVASGLNIQWTCLSRVDTVNEEMLGWMKKAGCKRIYFGVESGSPKILDYLNKEVDVEQARENLLTCRKMGIETAGFFMLGYPVETAEDLEHSIDFAIRSKLSFIAVAEITPYPGTALYNRLRDRVDFSLFPYKNEFKDRTLHENFLKNERIFFRRFYLRPRYLWHNFAILARNAREIAGIFAGMVTLMVKSRRLYAFKYMRSK